jgi:glycosyltransferase involved in cell wall biosynthesis
MRVGRFKTLHIITTLPRLSGAADNTRYTVNLLDQRRYEVHLAFGAPDPDTTSVAPHVRLIPIPSLVRPVALIRDARALWELYRLMRRERYDIVHTHNSKAGVVGRLAARLAGVPVIVHTAHTIVFAASTNQIVNWLYRTTERAIAPLTTKIITVSTLNTTVYLAAGIGTRDQYTTIYSGVETAKFLARPDRAACRAELGLAASEPFVLWVGRLNRQKDPLTFVRACRHLADQFPSARFALVGEDSVGQSLEPQVRALIQALDLARVVRLLGYRADIPRLLAAADLVMHTSVFEGLGRSVVETMLAGVPLVATAVDGVQEAVDSGMRGGLLVPPKDPAALASSAARLLTDAELAARLARGGREWAAQRFEVGEMARAIERLYESLSKDRRDLHRTS